MTTEMLAALVSVLLQASCALPPPPDPEPIDCEQVERAEERFPDECADSDADQDASVDAAVDASDDD